MSRRKYTFEQRLEVVMHYFASDEGYRMTSARFNIPRTQVKCGQQPMMLMVKKV
jgi:transposase